MKIKGLEHNYTISNVSGLGLVVIGRGKRKLKGQVVMLGQHADMESAIEAVNKYEHFLMKQAVDKYACIGKLKL